MSRYLQSNDPIPDGCISLSDAFEEYRRMLIPELDDPEQEWDDPERERDEERINEAERLFRAALCAGELCPLIRDPVDRGCLQLNPRSAWERGNSFGGWGMGMGDFVFPGDLLAPGPDTIIDGMARPVFFRRDEFRSWLSGQRNKQPLSEDNNGGTGPASMAAGSVELRRSPPSAGFAVAEEYWPFPDPPPTQRMRAQAYTAMKRKWGHLPGVPRSLSWQKIAEEISGNGTLFGADTCKRALGKQ